MLQNGIQFAGDSLPANKVTIKNKTGAALVVGAVYAFDLKKVDADTLTSRDQLTNVVAVSADNIDGILVVATKALADDEVGEAIVQGPAEVLVKGDVTAVLAGDRLKANAGQTYLSKASEAAGSTDVTAAKALDPYTGAPALKAVYFMGFNFNVNTNAAST